MNTAYCIWCNEKTPYEIKRHKKRLIKRNGIEFFAKEIYAECRKCGFEVYVPEVNDRNVAIRENAYYRSLRRRRSPAWHYRSQTKLNKEA